MKARAPDKEAVTGVVSRLQREPADSLPARERLPASLPPVTYADTGAHRWRDALYKRALALADVVSAALAVAVALVVLGDEALSPILIVALPAIIVIGKLLGLYDRDEHVLYKGTLEEAPRLFSVATLYALLMVLGADVLYEGDLGQAQLAALWVLLFTLMVALRAVVRMATTRTVEPERCLMLGNASATARVRERLEATEALNAVVLGRVPLGAEPDHRNPGVLGTMDCLVDVLIENRIQRVIVAPSADDGHDGDFDQLVDSIRLVTSLGVKVSMLPRLLEVVGSTVRVDDAYGLLLLSLPGYGLGRSSRLLKRTFDVIAAGAGLVLLAPLLAAIALSIKRSSPGPVLFRQRRIGSDGSEFEMLKFRSMVVDAEERKQELQALNEAGSGLFKIEADPRVTRVGMVLRRFALDELPQLVNVLRGEMSLVGPRPLVPEDDRWIEGWDRRRHHMPPGMTGVWQILGSSRVPLPEMVKIDYHYGATWSLGLDLKILLRTVSYALAGRGI